MQHTTTIDSPIDEVIAWHERAGAIDRLLPPWLPLRVLAEARSLESGTAKLRMPLGLVWSARHVPQEYQPRRRFVDELSTPVLAGLIRWRHEHDFEPLSATSTKVTDTINGRVPRRMIAQTLGYRARQLRDDLTSHARAAALADPYHTDPHTPTGPDDVRGPSGTIRPLTIGITGSTGFIGSSLCPFLSTGGHRVVQFVRRPPSSTPRYAEERQWDPDDPAPDLLDGVDAVIHLAGESVAGRFNERMKAELLDSRVGPTRKLAELMGTRPFVVASGVGFYGPDRGDEVLTEQSSAGGGFLADLSIQWEAAADPARESGSRVTHVRTGIVQSPRGGVLQMLRPLFVAGVGGRLGSGRQWVPWISIDDMVDIYLRCVIDPRLEGPINAVAPEPVTNLEYTKVLAHVLRRPGIVPVPALGPKILFGSEAVDEFILAGQRAAPGVLQDIGHEFRHTTLELALRHLLGRFDVV